MTAWRILFLLLLPWASARADDAVVGSGGPAGCTEAALDAALATLYPGANFPGGVLSFSCGPMPISIPLSSRKFLTGATVVDGGGLVTLDGQGGSGIFAISGAGSQIEIRHITLDRGFSATNGGAIDVGADTALWLHHAEIGNSEANASGGAIHVAAGASLSLQFATFRNNQAANGGAIASNGPTVMEDSLFDNNEAGFGGEGGAIEIWFARLQAVRTVFSNNRADSGGALALRGVGSDFSRLDDVQLLANLAITDGGAAVLYDGAKLLGGRVLARANQADQGAVVALRGSNAGVGDPRQIGPMAFFELSRFESNLASSAGGVAFVAGPPPLVGGVIGQLILQDCGLEQNNALEGGAIYSRGQVLLFDSWFERNGAQLGGALSLQRHYAIGQTDLLAYTQIRNIRFLRNTAQYGGAVYAHAHLVVYEGVLFEGNGAVEGGALYQQGFTPPIGRASFINNQATDAGGAILVRDSGSIQLYNLVFDGNQATDVGGRGGQIAIESSGNVGALAPQISIWHSTLLDGVGDSGSSLAATGPLAEISLRNSVLYSDGAPCVGDAPILSAGGNFLPASCTTLQPNDHAISSRAELGLQGESNSAGDVVAFVPAPDSILIDAVDCTSGRDRDIRELPAPVDGNADLDPRCDAGSAERQVQEPVAAYRLHVDGFEPR